MARGGGGRGAVVEAGAGAAREATCAVVEGWPEQGHAVEAGAEAAEGARRSRGVGGR